VLYWAGFALEVTVNVVIISAAVAALRIILAIVAAHE
jgi:hypothetical protein